MTHRSIAVPRSLHGALALVAFCMACSAPRTAGDGRGTLIIATSADADHLLPPVVLGLVGKQIVDQVFDYLADPPATLNTVGDAGFTPRLARRWRWSADSLSIAFELDARARWHDGTPVRAADVRFTVQALKDSLTASPIASNITNVDSVSVVDSLTAIAWFHERNPEQFFELVYNVAILPEHLLASVPRDQYRESEFARHPIGSGRFRFARWVPGSTIELVADTTNYRGRPRLDRVMWSVTLDPGTLVPRLLAQEVDFVEVVRGEGLKQVGGSGAARLVGYPSLDYAYVGFNLRSPNRTRPHPVLGDARLRRALALGVDRHAIVRNVLDTLGFVGIGPVVRAQASADPSLAELPYDTVHARALLDSLGWRDGNGDGVRERGGTRLAFAISLPSSSASRKQAAILLQEAWRRIGAAATIEALEPNLFFQRIGKGQFDVMLNAMHNDPSPAAVRQTWGSSALPEKGGSNFTGYASPAFDAYVDSAGRSFDPARSRAFYRKAYEQINDDVPAIWLFEPRYAAGASKRIAITGVRADAWWAGMPDWSVAPGQRIGRDHIGLTRQLTQGTPRSTP